MVEWPGGRPQLPTLTLVSGKGGVGKSTCACAMAATQAQAHPEATVLLLSTDPAHSLGDVLQLTITDEPRPHPQCPNLHLRALDADRLLSQFQQDYGPVLEMLVERGSFVEGADLGPVWEMGWPGLNELMALLEIQRLLRAGAADWVVVDMAPSGHTLNLFGLMDFLDQFLGALTLFQEKHRYMKTALAGRYEADGGDRFLAEMTADLAQGRAQLQDAQGTACWMVALAEPLSLRETERFQAALTSLGIPVGGLIVNQVDPDNGTQGAIVADFCALGIAVWQLPRWPQEPLGLDRLLALWGAIAPAQPSNSLPIPPLLWPDPVPPPAPDFIAQGRRLLIVGGKGGVGKTTVAAAIALAQAEQHPDIPVTVISIDPAHSLGDALEVPLGHQAIGLTPNLQAQEIDSETLLEEFRQTYLWDLAAMMGGNNDLGGGLTVAYGPQGWRQMVSQSLPGIDEMLALLAVMERLQADPQALVVLDTAPTGHLLQFLAMPTALGDWLAWIFRLWIKYQDVAGHADLMGRLRGLRRQVMQAQRDLTNGSHTEFIGVVQAQGAIVAEAVRLQQQLVSQGVAQHWIVHNRYRPDQSLDPDLFPDQTILRIPELPPTAHPRLQVNAAAHLLYPAPGDGSTE